mgnify:CR=1 FL=1
MQELQVNIEQAKVEIVGQEVFEKGIAAVSYTHLTLPTNREV